MTWASRGMLENPRGEIHFVDAKGIKDRKKSRDLQNEDESDTLGVSEAFCEGEKPHYLVNHTARNEPRCTAPILHLSRRGLERSVRHTKKEVKRTNERQHYLDQ